MRTSFLCDICSTLDGTTEQLERRSTWVLYSKITMGVKAAASILFSLKGVCLTALKNIARSRLQENNHLCFIDVDCSWLGYKLGRKSNGNDASTLTAEILLLLSKAGFIVTPVCDPPHRHHSKRASTERIASREKKRIDSLVSRYKITQISQRLRGADAAGLTVEEIAQMERDLTELNKKAKVLERDETSGRLGGSFAEDLSRELERLNAHEKNEHQCFVGKVVVASFQADSYIARRAVMKKNANGFCQ